MLKFGVIGFSNGNGHPFSWSAILNGYDEDLIARSGFPVIAEYLRKENFPSAQLEAARVTHAWSQEPKRTQLLSECCGIRNVVDAPQDMIGRVDAVLLARDDARNHRALAMPFLTAGVPIFIDKPLALTVDEAEQIYKLEQRPGLIYTCSALAHAPELRPTAEQLAQIGRIRHIDCSVPNSWETYAIHAIDPLLALLPSAKVRSTNSINVCEERVLDVEFESPEITCRIVASGVFGTPIRIRILGDRNTVELTFTNAFRAFKAALSEFAAIVNRTRQPQDPRTVMRRVALVEAGLNS